MNKLGSAGNRRDVGVDVVGNADAVRNGGSHVSGKVVDVAVICKSAGVVSGVGNGTGDAGVVRNGVVDVIDVSIDVVDAAVIVNSTGVVSGVSNGMCDAGVIGKAVGETTIISADAISIGVIHSQIGGAGGISNGISDASISNGISDASISDGSVASSSAGVHTSGTSKVNTLSNGSSDSGVIRSSVASADDADVNAIGSGIGGVGVNGNDTVGAVINDAHVDSANAVEVIRNGVSVSDWQERH